MRHTATEARNLIEECVDNYRLVTNRYETKEAVMAFKIKFEEVSFTNLNSVRVDTYSEEDLVNCIKSGYDEVKRLAELATISKSSAMQEEADNLTAQVIRVGVILDGRAKERLDKAEALANK